MDVEGLYRHIRFDRLAVINTISRISQASHWLRVTHCLTKFLMNWWKCVCGKASIFRSCKRNKKDCFKIPVLLPFYSDLPRLADLTVACQEKEHIFCFSTALWISCFGRRWIAQKYIVYLKSVENTKRYSQDCCTVKATRDRQFLSVQGISH